MYESVFWSSYTATHDDWSISTVANYIMLKNTWCWSDFYAKFLWSCDLRTYKEGITEIFCFESIWPISKQFVEIDCSLLLNIKPKRSTWTAVVFLGQVTLYSDYLLQPPPALYYLTNSVLQSVFLPTVLVDHGKKLGQKASFWLDKTHLLSSWVETECSALVQLIEMKCFHSGVPKHFIFCQIVEIKYFGTC